MVGIKAFFISFLLSPLVGLVAVSFSEKNVAKPNRYLEYLELAKRAEFKNRTEEAIDHYLDAIYFLEHDYKDIEVEEYKNQSRMKRIEEIQNELKRLRVTSDLSISR